jgi:hypothetical protein
MEPDKKKSYIARNLEWITLVLVILAGLLIVWRLFYPGLFTN